MILSHTPFGLYNQRSFGLGAATVSDPAFSSEKDALKWLETVYKWMSEQEKIMQQWYTQLLQTVAYGIASCAEIQQFNAQSIAFFNTQSYFMAKLNGAGAPIPAYPPHPPLFASNVSSVYDDSLQREIIKANLNCLPNGYPDTSKVEILPAGWCKPSGGELGAIPLFVWVGVTTLLVGATLWLVAQGGSKFWRSFSGTDKKALDVQMLDMQRKLEMQRQQALNLCYDKRAAAMKPNENTEENRRAIMDQCRGVVADAAKVKLPFTKDWFTSAIAVAALIGAGTLAYSVISKRHAA